MRSGRPSAPKFGSATSLPDTARFIAPPSVVVNNEAPCGQTRFRLFSDRPRHIGPKALSKICFIGLQRTGQIIVSSGRRLVVECSSGKIRRTMGYSGRGRALICHSLRWVWVLRIISCFSMTAITRWPPGKTGTPGDRPRRFFAPRTFTKKFTSTKSGNSTES